MTEPFVTIIIPTYKDWERLALCVNALEAQTYPSDRFNVIIVNNDPADNRPADFYLPHNFKLITEEKPGSYAARNAALRIAQGEILGFTDSDCIPDKNWIGYAVDYFKNNEGCTRIAGKVAVFPKGAKATLGEKYDKLYAFRQKRYVTQFGTCVTANVFSYKTVFDKAGFFNDNQMSYGDLDWGIKAHNAGSRIDYVEQVVVNHPARYMNELIKKEKRLAGGKEKLNNKKYKKHIVFLKFFKEARPRVRGMYKYIWTNAADLSSGEKFSLLMVKFMLNYVRAYETMRIRLGKKPNRA